MTITFTQQDFQKFKIIVISPSVVATTAPSLDGAKALPLSDEGMATAVDGGRDLPLF